MLDELINLVKEHAGDAIVNNPAIPNEKNDAAISTTATGILDTLKEQFTSGNLQGICNLFIGGNAGSNPITAQISQNVTAQLAQKFGLDTNAAGNIASGLIPKVMNGFVNKTNDPNDNSFNVEGIMASLGSQSGALGSLMDSVKGFMK